MDSIFLTPHGQFVNVKMNDIKLIPPPALGINAFDFFFGPNPKGFSVLTPDADSGILAFCKYTVGINYINKKPYQYLLEVDFHDNLAHYGSNNTTATLSNHWNAFDWSFYFHQFFN